MPKDITKTVEGKMALEILRVCRKYTEKEAVALRGIAYALGVIIKNTEEIGLIKSTWADVPRPKRVKK